MGFLQNRHRPPSLIQPRTGMLSYHGSSFSHLGQCDGGVTSDSPRGSRQTTTFKKLPMHAPSTNRETIASAGGIGGKREGMVRQAAPVRLPGGFRNRTHPHEWRGGG